MGLKAGKRNEEFAQAPSAFEENRMAIAVGGGFSSRQTKKGGKQKRIP